MVRIRQHITYPVRVKSIAGSRTSRFWTEAEDQMIRDLYLSNEATVLAVRIGRTAEAIITRAARIGVVKFPNVAAGKRRQLERLQESNGAHQNHSAV